MHGRRILVWPGALALVLFVAWFTLVGAQEKKNTGSISGTLSGFPAGKDPLVVFVEGAKAAQRTHTVSQIGAQFQPGFVVVGAGDRIAFPNDDKITHNVFSVSPAKKFDLGLYKPGSAQTVVFDKPGVADLFCSIHENMHAVVAVVPSGHYTAADKEGRFKLSGVPAGRHQLVVWRKGAEMARQEVVVEVGKEATTGITRPAK